MFRHADQFLTGQILLCGGHTHMHIHIEHLGFKAGRDLIKQPFHKDCCLRLRPIFHPDRELIAVKTHRHDPSAVLVAKFPTAAGRQPAQLFQDHVSEHDTVLLVDLFQSGQKHIDHHAVIFRFAAFLYHAAARAERIEPGDAVRRTSSELFRLPRFLFLYIADAAHDLSTRAVCVINRLPGQRYPLIICIIKPFDTKFDIQPVFPLLQCVDHQLPVHIVDILRIDKTALKFIARPLTAHRLMIDNIQHMILDIIGEEHILAGL